MADIFADQAGYLPNGVKKAVMTFPSESFSLKDSGGNVRFSGKTFHFGYDAVSGDDVYIADFSSFSESGNYCIEADNGSSSESFEIGSGVINKSLDIISKAYYFLRCGSGLDRKYAGAYSHPCCHTENAVLWEDNSVYMDVSGGWHDAGDYGRYVTAGACALAHLLYGYMLFPKPFDRQNLNIPESGGKLPDILAECKVELDWIMKMQRKDGAVYHKATTAHHAPFIMPEDDISKMYVLPVSSMATADLAAVCALASRVYRDFDIEYADKLLEAAKSSFEWLENNPDFLGFKNPKGCATGEYGERDDRDNRFWAAAELYAAERGERYRKALDSFLEEDIPLTHLGYASLAGFGSLAYLTGGDRDELYEKIKSAFLKDAEDFRDMSDKCGYGAAMRKYDYFWGSNMVMMKRAMTFAIADRLFGHREYRDYAALQTDVLFGMNALGISYVTGIGKYRCNNPHLRPAYADGIDESIPGMVSGGPNSRPADTEARRIIKEGTPPMKCYADRVSCYSLNEITIYWNSPAVFVLAYLEDCNNE